MDFLKPILGRIIGSLVAGLAAYLATKYGIELTAESQAAITGFAVALGSIFYAITHRAVNSKINPVDAARVSTAVETKENVDAIADARKSQINLP